MCRLSLSSRERGCLFSLRIWINDQELTREHQGALWNLVISQYEKYLIELAQELPFFDKLVCIFKHLLVTEYMPGPLIM